MAALTFSFESFTRSSLSSQILRSDDYDLLPNPGLDKRVRSLLGGLTAYYYSR